MRNFKDKILYKRKLIETCRKYLMKTADNLRTAMEDAQHSANEYGQPKDRYDSYRIQLLRKRDLLARQYQQALEQLNVLDKIGTEKLHKKVGFGSVVFTNEQKIFVSTGIGKINFEDEIFYAISPMVPVFNAMKGLIKGESYTFREKKITVLDIL